MYMRCPKQYEYAYVKKVPRPPPGISLAVGSGGHTALEYNARQKIKTGSDMHVGDLLDLSSDFIDTEMASVEKKTPTGRGHTKDTAIAAIRVFRQRDAPRITPIGTEIPFYLDINDPEEPNEEPIRIIKGFIDTIDSMADVEDYKFVGQRKSQPEVDSSPQLTLYGLVFKALTGRYANETGFRMFLPGNKKEGPDSETIHRSAKLMTPEAQEARFKRLKNQLQMVERGIRAEVFPATDNPITCSYCDYRPRCQDSLVPDDFRAAQIRGDI